MGGAGVEGGLGVVFDAELEGLGEGGAADFGGKGEGHVDSSGDSRGGDDFAGFDDPGVGREGSVGGETI